MNANRYDILIIDDNPDLKDILQVMLSLRGYHATTGDAREAEMIEYLNGGKLPDAIVLDMLLAGSDGRHICKNLKMNSATQHIPIIMISAHPDAEGMCKEAGADDFLRKPFEVNQLVTLINKNLEGHTVRG